MAPSATLCDIIRTTSLLILAITALALEPIATCVVAVFLGCGSNIACMAAGWIGIWGIHSLLTKSTKNRKNTTNRPQQMGTSPEESSSKYSCGMWEIK
jgi:hypothetical protein